MMRHWYLKLAYNEESRRQRLGMLSLAALLVVVFAAAVGGPSAKESTPSATARPGVTSQVTAKPTATPRRNDNSKLCSECYGSRQCDHCYGGTCRTCGGAKTDYCTGSHCLFGRCTECDDGQILTGFDRNGNAKYRKCSYCRYGKCKTCGGDYYVTCRDCRGTGKCGSCNGSGVCSACRGR